MINPEAFPKNPPAQTVTEKMIKSRFSVSAIFLPAVDDSEDTNNDNQWFFI